MADHNSQPQIPQGSGTYHVAQGGAGFQYPAGYPFPPPGYASHPGAGPVDPAVAAAMAAAYAASVTAPGGSFSHLVQYPPTGAPVPAASHHKYAFRAHGNQYMIAEENTLKLHHHLEQHGKQGYFTLEPLMDGIHVGLKASNGNYVAVDAKGHVYLAEHLRGDETSFKIEHSGVRIFIRSALDRYIGVNPLGHIHTQHHKGHHEEFEQILSQE